MSAQELAEKNREIQARKFADRAQFTPADLKPIRLRGERGGK